MIRFKDVRAYLDAIAKRNGTPLGTHGAFWNDLTYEQFKTQQVPNVGVPIMDTTNPLQSPFYLILTDPNGYQGLPRMPLGGPYIKDPGYEVTLADGTSITGTQIDRNLAEWLANDYPE